MVSKNRQRMSLGIEALNTKAMHPATDAGTAGAVFIDRWSGTAV
jgi:hypothetical protein